MTNPFQYAQFIHSAIFPNATIITHIFEYFQFFQNFLNDFIKKEHNKNSMMVGVHLKNQFFAKHKNRIFRYTP